MHGPLGHNSLPAGRQIGMKKSWSPFITENLKPTFSSFAQNCAGMMLIFAEIVSKKGVWLLYAGRATMFWHAIAISPSHRAASHQGQSRPRRPRGHFFPAALVDHLHFTPLLYLKRVRPRPLGNIDLAYQMACGRHPALGVLYRFKNFKQGSKPCTLISGMLELKLCNFRTRI